MNRWIERSIAYATQEKYLDDLFEVYPITPEGPRTISVRLWHDVEEAFNGHQDELLIAALLRLELFPIKDSYVAYLKRDKEAIRRNPATIARLASRLYAMGLTSLYQKCSEPKETNRQIGPLFKRWLRKGSLGLKMVRLEEFMGSSDDAILDASDAEMMTFAKNQLNYMHAKGLDFVARIHKTYIIGEAKFLTDFGGHQNAQFNDAIATVKAENVRATKIAILDGVLYIKGKNKMYRSITETYADENIMSALMLNQFLHSL